MLLRSGQTYAPKSINQKCLEFMDKVEELRFGRGVIICEDDMFMRMISFITRNVSFFIHIFILQNEEYATELIQYLNTMTNNAIDNYGIDLYVFDNTVIEADEYISKSEYIYNNIMFNVTLENFNKVDKFKKNTLYRINEHMKYFTTQRIELVNKKVYPDITNEIIGFLNPCIC